MKTTSPASPSEMMGAAMVTVAVERLGDEHAALARLGAVDTAVLHNLLELRADALADEVAARLPAAAMALSRSVTATLAGRLAQRVATAARQTLSTPPMREYFLKK